MRNHYTKDLLEPAILSSKSWSEVCRRLNVKPSTGAQTHLTKRAKSFNINTSHFIGKTWNRGRTFTKKPVAFYLKKNSKVKSHDLKMRLIRANLKQYKCEGCHLSEWNDKAIPLELHHINKDHTDNRLENLAILCPNCHAQQ